MPNEIDHVDWALERWREQRPDLDTSVKAVTQRIGRAGRFVERATTARMLAEFGLHPHEFYVLGVLRRTGPPFRLTPTQLARTLLLTTGSVTNRVDRLERAGLVVRSADARDRRVVHVELTRPGLELADRAVNAHVAAEAQVVAAFSAEEREQLAALLRKLLLVFRDVPPAPAAAPGR